MSKKINNLVRSINGIDVVMDDLKDCKKKVLRDRLGWKFEKFTEMFGPCSIPVTFGILFGILSFYSSGWVIDLQSVLMFLISEIINFPLGIYFVNAGKFDADKIQKDYIDPLDEQLNQIDNLLSELKNASYDLESVIACEANDYDLVVDRMYLMSDKIENCDDIYEFHRIKDIKYLYYLKKCLLELIKKGTSNNVVQVDENIENEICCDVLNGDGSVAVRGLNY